MITSRRHRRGIPIRCARSFPRHRVLPSPAATTSCSAVIALCIASILDGASNNGNATSGTTYVAASFCNVSFETGAPRRRNVSSPSCASRTSRLTIPRRVRRAKARASMLCATQGRRRTALRLQPEPAARRHGCDQSCGSSCAALRTAAKTRALAAAGCAFGERLAVALHTLLVGFRPRVTRADGSGTTRIRRT